MALLQLKFGPTDHGRPVTEEELDGAEYAEGYKYEIIDGRFYVSPQPSFYEERLERWLRRKIERFADDHPEVVQYVSQKARVFIPDAPELTVPEPDIAVYKEDLNDFADGESNWPDFSPVIVCEVLLDADPEKDLVRNVELYWQVPSIREYWILDGRENPNQPLLIARRRHGSRWLIQEVPYGEVYRTPTLPGFELLIDPRQ